MSERIDKKVSEKALALDKLSGRMENVTSQIAMLQTALERHREDFDKRNEAYQRMLKVQEDCAEMEQEAETLRVWIQEVRNSDEVDTKRKTAEYVDNYARWESLTSDIKVLEENVNKIYYGKM